MRPVQIMQELPSKPHVCVKCGTGVGKREHFVDLGIDSEMAHVDDYQQIHIYDGVVYFCNMCMTGLITDYLNLLFKFINGQRVGLDLASANNSEALFIQQKEIEHLRGVIADREKELNELKATIEFARSEAMAEVTETSAEETLDGILGNEPGTDTPDSNSDAAGTDQSSDGNDSADESLTSSDLTDLKAGFRIKT